MARPKPTCHDLRLAVIYLALLLTTKVNLATSSFCRECAPFIPGAVAYWPMTSGTDGSDLSGNYNSVTLVGLTYTDGLTGVDNGAVHFNGSSNSFASVTNSPSMNIGKYSGFSFSGYVRYLGITKYPTSLIDWSGPDGYGVYILVSPEQVIQLQLHPSNDFSQHKAEFPSHKLNKGAWHFIGVSYDKAMGKATMFKDGQLEVKQLEKNIIAGSNKTSEVGLGTDLADPIYNYHGDMSCMMLFKFALTADDFTRVMDFCRTTQSTQTVLPNITVSDIAATIAIASWTKSPGIFSEYSIAIERKEVEIGLEIVHPEFIQSSVTCPETFLTNLVPGATYRVHVWHMQGDTKGRARSSAWFHTEPSLVVESNSIIFSEITATSAKVSWKDVTGNYDGYTLGISPTTGGARADPSSVPRGTTETSLKNLSQGSSYTITIKTKVGLHMTDPSTPRSLYIPGIKEPSVVVESDSIIFSEISATSAKVSWKDVTGNYDGYSVDIIPTTGGARADPSTVPRGTTNTTLLNLTAGRSYIVRIRTKIGSRTSWPSMKVVHTLGPSNATLLSAQTTFDASKFWYISAVVDSAVVGILSIVVIAIAVCVLVRRRRSLRSSYGYTTQDLIKMKPLKIKKREPTKIGYTKQYFIEMMPLKSKKRKATKIETTVMSDLKKRYQSDYRSILLLPYRQDRVTDTNQLSRNFEKRTFRGYENITLENIFEEADRNHKSNRFVLEALAGYGKSSLMKKLAYMWATNDEKLNHHFKFVFLINTDDFIEFQKNAENPTRNHLGDFVSQDTFFSDQNIESCHNRGEIWRLVQENEEKVLFIIDTNYKSELPDDLHKLFFGKTMRDSTVILTCRTNQVPTMIRDKAHMFTFIRIAKHDPATLKGHILDYFDSQGKGEMGNVLVQKLRIENVDYNEIRDDVKLSWITTPFVLVIIVNVWQDIWETEESFCLDEPYIYQKVVKNIFKYYECCKGGMSTRVNHAVEGNTYTQETLTLGRLAWGLIENNKSSIPAKKIGPLKDDDGEANVLRNIGVLRPIMIAEDGIPKEKYKFTDKIWKFYFAARFLRNEIDQGKMKDKDIHNAVEMVRNLNKNIEGLFKKIIDLPTFCDATDLCVIRGVAHASESQAHSDLIS